MNQPGQKQKTCPSCGGQVGFVFALASRKFLFSVAKDGVMPALTSLTIQLYHHVFDLGVVFKGIQGLVFADTALFITAMRHLRGQRQVIIDPNRAKLENTARAHGLEDISCPDRSGQAIDHVIGLFQHFFLGLEAADDDNGTKDFTLHNLGIVAVLSNHGWFEEEAFLEAGNSGTLTARDDVRAIAQGALDETFNIRTLGGRNQWTHVGVLPGRVTNANLLDFIEEHAHEGVIDAVLYVDTCGSRTVLAAVDETADYRTTGRSIDICISINDEGSFAAEFEVHALDGVSSLTHNMFATLSAACDRDHVDSTMGGKRLCYTGTTADDVEYPGRETSLLSDFTKFERGERGLDRRLEDNGVASGKGWTNLPGGHHEGIVPWSQRRDNTDGLTANDAGVTTCVLTGGCTSKLASSPGKDMEIVDGERHVAITGQFK